MKNRLFVVVWNPFVVAELISSPGTRALPFCVPPNKDPTRYVLGNVTTRKLWVEAHVRWTGGEEWSATSAAVAISSASWVCYVPIYLYSGSASVD
jgi:hypothetical protein